MIPSLSGAALWLSSSFELSLLAKATIILLAGFAVTALARDGAGVGTASGSRDIVRRAPGPAAAHRVRAGDGD